MFIAIWKLIARDRLVLYPAMIGGFANALLMQRLLAHLKDMPLLFAYAIALWFISVFIQLLVAALGNEAAHGKTPDFGALLWTAIRRFFPAISVMLILVISIALLYWVSTAHLILRALVLVPLFVAALVIQLYPVIYVMTNSSALRSMLTLSLFIRRRTLWFAQLAFLLLLISFSFILFSSVLTELPAAWQSVSVPLLQGLYVVVLNYAIVITWFIQSKVQEVA